MRTRRACVYLLLVAPLTLGCGKKAPNEPRQDDETVTFTGLEVNLGEELPKKGGAGVKHLRLARTRPPAGDEDLALVKANYPSLESLDLDETRVTCKGLEALHGMTKLETLRLRDNPQIDDTCWPVFYNLPALNALFLRGTKVTAEKAKTWETAKPGRRVTLQ